MTVTMSWNGDAADRAVRDAAARGLFQAAEHVRAESVKVAPIEESTLVKSAATSVDEAALTASVSYDTVYAARQHEELTWRHDAGRQAKYLEEPLNREQDTVLKIIGDAIGEALK